MNRRSFLKGLAAAIASAPLISHAKLKPLGETTDTVGYIDDVNKYDYAKYPVTLEPPQEVLYPTPRSVYVELSDHVAEQFRLPRKCVIADVGGSLSDAKWPVGKMHARAVFFANYIYDVKHDRVLKDRYNPVSLQVKRETNNEYIPVLSVDFFNNRFDKRVDLSTKS